MIKLLENLGGYESGEIIKLAKRKEQRLVSKGIAIFVQTLEPCYKYK